MGVLRYIPRKKEIIDRRSADGGYYESECDHCGSIYYPKRSSAKFCSRACTVMAYRMNKKPVNAPKQPQKDIITKLQDCLGVDEVINFLYRYNYNLSMQRGIIKQSLKDLDVKDIIHFGIFIITKTSDRKYVAYVKNEHLNDVTMRQPIEIKQPHYDTDKIISEAREMVARRKKMLKK
jgi:hypothetical protein